MWSPRGSRTANASHGLRPFRRQRLDGKREEGGSLKGQAAQHSIRYQTGREEKCYNLMLINNKPGGLGEEQCYNLIIIKAVMIIKADRTFGVNVHIRLHYLGTLAQARLPNSVNHIDETLWDRRDTAQRWGRGSDLSYPEGLRAWR